MRLILDEQLCQGYASCVVAAPDMFELDDDEGIARILKKEPVGADDQKSAEVAVANCPARAIRLSDD